MALRPGQVRDSITAYLAKRGVDGASISEIHAAVEKSLGTTVAASSVRSYLRLNTATTFERIGHGKYRARNR